jgi:hypothetical protein
VDGSAVLSLAQADIVAMSLDPSVTAGFTSASTGSRTSPPATDGSQAVAVVAPGGWLPTAAPIHAFTPGGQDMTAINPVSVRLRPSGLSSRKIGGELVVLDFNSSHYFTIRGSGIFLFELLQEKHEREDLIASLLARFDVEEDTARRDVDKFLSDLSNAGLLST